MGKWGFDLSTLTMVVFLLFIEAITTLLAGTQVNSLVSLTFSFFVFQLLSYSLGFPCSLVSTYVTNWLVESTSESYYSQKALANLAESGNLALPNILRLEPEHFIKTNLANTWLMRSLNGAIFVGLQIGFVYFAYLILLWRIVP